MTAVRKLHPDPPETTSTDVASDHGSGPERAVSRTGSRRAAPASREPLKRWGFITARPSEYLIHVRRGRIQRRTTGQGASCFKWPWDSVAIVPTTIHRLQFRADQVTREKVGLAVTGLAVYRIVAPELTFRMLDFSAGEAAVGELAEILREMFVGATRRHVANLTVEQVMTQRKDAIAAELMRELTPVLDGSGRVDDATVCGWGVVLDTVEIQNVQVLSDRVFGDMQAQFRADLAARARQAQLESTRSIALAEASSQREIEAARLEAERAGRELRATAETRAQQTELSQQSIRAVREAQAEEEKIARDQTRELLALRSRAEVAAEQAEREEASALARIERQRRLADAEAGLAVTAHRHQIEAAARSAQLRTAEQEIEHRLREVQSRLDEEIRRRELEVHRLEDQVQAERDTAYKHIDNLVSEGRIRLALVERALPAIAESLAPASVGDVGELRITQLGGLRGDDSMNAWTRGLVHLTELAHALGVTLPGTRAERDPEA